MSLYLFCRYDRISKISSYALYHVYKLNMLCCCCNVKKHSHIGQVLWNSTNILLRLCLHRHTNFVLCTSESNWNHSRIFRGIIGYCNLCCCHSVISPLYLLKCLIVVTNYVCYKKICWRNCNYKVTRNTVVLLTDVFVTEKKKMIPVAFIVILITIQGKCKMSSTNFASSHITFKFLLYSFDKGVSVSCQYNLRYTTSVWSST